MIPHTYFQSSTIRVLLCQSISVDLPDSVLISKLKCSTTLWSQCYFDAVDWCICHVVVLVPILVFCDIVAEECNTPIRVHDFQISCVNRYNRQMNLMNLDVRPIPNLSYWQKHIRESTAQCNLSLYLFLFAQYEWSQTLFTCLLLSSENEIPRAKMSKFPCVSWSCEPWWPLITKWQT